MADQPQRSGGAAPLDDDAIAAGTGGVDAQPDSDYAALGQRIGELIDGLDANADKSVGKQVDELLVAFDRIHRDALRRLAGLLAHHELLDHAVTDPVVAMVLDLYDLRPEGTAPAAAPSEAPTPAPQLPVAPKMIRLQDIRRIPADPKPAPLVAPAAGPKFDSIKWPAATMPSSAAPPAQGPKMLESLLGAPPSPLDAIPQLPGAAPVPGTPETALSRATPAQAASPQAAPRTTPAEEKPRSRVTQAAPTFEAARPEPPLTDESGAVIPADGPPEWTTLFTADHVPPGTLVASGDGEVLICNIDGVLHAVRNRCGGSPLPLHFGEIADGHLVCPWHKRCDYDLTNGESTSTRRTVVYPVRLEGDRVSVALNHGRSTGPLQPMGLRAAPM